MQSHLYHLSPPALTNRSHHPLITAPSPSQYRTVLSPPSSPNPSPNWSLHQGPNPSAIRRKYERHFGPLSRMCLCHLAARDMFFSRCLSRDTSRGLLEFARHFAKLTGRLRETLYEAGRIRETLLGAGRLHETPQEDSRFYETHHETGRVREILHEPGRLCETLHETCRLCETLREADRISEILHEAGRLHKSYLKTGRNRVTLYKTGGLTLHETVCHARH